MGRTSSWVRKWCFSVVHSIPGQDWGIFFSSGYPSFLLCGLIPLNLLNTDQKIYSFVCIYLNGCVLIESIKYMCGRGGYLFHFLCRVLWFE